MIQSFKKTFYAGKNALSGLFYGLFHERAVRQETVLFMVLGTASFFIAQGPLDYVLLLTPLFLVLIAEFLNTAIEKTLDLISNHYHPLIKRAKDMASAAVFLSLLLLCFLWAVVITKNFF